MASFSCSLLGDVGMHLKNSSHPIRTRYSTESFYRQERLATHRRASGIDGKAVAMTVELRGRQFLTAAELLMI
jgi:hypothetical protein